MSSAYRNFTCSDPDLDHANLTVEVWELNSESLNHERGVLAYGIILLLYVLVGLPWNVSLWHHSAALCFSGITMELYCDYDDTHRAAFQGTDLFSPAQHGGYRFIESSHPFV